MEKTKFEIRKSVLAECETICKDPMQCYGIGDGLKISKSSSQYVIEYQDDRGSWWILATINRHTESSASLVLTFYSLLGLDKRDALEAERGKSAKLVSTLDMISKWDGELDYEWGGYKNCAAMALEAYKEGKKDE